MGRYYNPPEGISVIGRRLNGSDYEELVSQLEVGELLFGVYSFPVESAALIDSIEEYDRQEGRGLGRFYAVLKHLADDGLGP